MTEPSVTLRLPPEPSAAAEARRFTASRIDAWDLRGVKDSGLLLVSELVTNAVLHARTALVLDLTCTGRGLRVCVCDEADTALPDVAADVDGSLECGRGLMLVSTLADRWGCERCPPGKRLWFELDSCT